MKTWICEIDLNEGEGRQKIYWDSEDHLLHSDADDDEENNDAYYCESLEDAQDTAWSLWGCGAWGFEWIDEEEN